MLVRILIADDHAIVRDGLRMILESAVNLHVVGEAKTGREAVSKAEALRPDVVIMDVTMPELNGIDATRTICEILPAVKVVMLSMHNTSEHVFRALQAGARGYVLKESAGTGIVNAVREVMRGRCYFSEGVAVSQLSGSPCVSPPKSPLESLSQREREVIQLVVEGKTSSEIAEVLNLSPKSVETYRSRLMQKLEVSNIPSLVKFAILHGITPSA